ncbi:MAG: FKBP-type peptidyl-prolyl cis-trans isomerase FkpA [Marivirga sp.]|jgi:FKBP-type peptidyl-prolyl cis-trans isomerase FkpA
MMTFKNSTLLITILSILFTSCQQSEKKATADGVEYYLLSTEDGAPYEEGDYAIYYLKLMDENDSVLIDSKDVGMLPLKVDSTTFTKRGNLFSVLGAMSVGDSVRSVLTASEVYSKGFRQPLSDGMNLNDRITIVASAKEKFDSAGFENWKVQMREEMMAKMQKESLEQQVTNQASIKEYIEENSLSAERTESGLLYVVKEMGKGSLPESGQTVKVNYTGMLLSGKVFDTSIAADAKEAGMFNEQKTYQPISFALGRGQVIRGWDEGLALLPIGSKAQLIIPSELGYGPRGSGAAIPPNAVLVFNVELIAAE